MSAKAYYYRNSVDAEGKPYIERMGPVGADGDWPARYAAKGWSITPPEAVRQEQAELDLDSLSYNDLRLMAAGLSLKSVGVKRPALLSSIREAQAREAKPEGDESEGADKTESSEGQYT